MITPLMLWREPRGQDTSDGIRLKIHCNDRNRRRRVRRRPDGGRAHRQDHIRLEPDRFGCIFTKSRLAAGRESILDENALSLDVAEVAESLPEHFLWRPLASGRNWVQLDDPKDLRCRLCLDHARRSEETDSQCDCDHDPSHRHLGG
jgi:hypothetical protein